MLRAQKRDAHATKCEVFAAKLDNGNGEAIELRKCVICFKLAETLQGEIGNREKVTEEAARKKVVKAGEEKLTCHLVLVF